MAIAIHRGDLRGALLGTVLICLSSVSPGLHARQGANDQDSPSLSFSGDQHYTQVNLVSNKDDALLVNPWGIVFNPNAVVWIADNGSGYSTLYDGQGNKIALNVKIPSPSGGQSKPTGIVFNSSFDATKPDFVVRAGGKMGPSVFIFSTEDGSIAGWSPTVNQNNAIQVVNRSGAKAIYKGLAIGANGNKRFIYATDFHNGRIDVFDGTFQRLIRPESFKDPAIPPGYGPFGIQNINGALYVTYAKQDANKEDDVAGPGFGFVSIFDTDGKFLGRLISRGKLNAPWGLALAPANFGAFGNRLLVGNFGDGKINAYDLATGEFKGHLLRPSGMPLAIDGLWGLSFGNGINHQPTNVLFVTAGPNDEANGLYARIEAVTP